MAMRLAQARTNQKLSGSRLVLAATIIASIAGSWLVNRLDPTEPLRDEWASLRPAVSARELSAILQPNIRRMYEMH